MFESLESLLKKENMNKFLDEIFDGVDKKHIPCLISSVLPASIQIGITGKNPPVIVGIKDMNGKTSKEEKENIDLCIKKLYSFGYNLGLDMLENAKAENGLMKKERFEYAYSNLIGLLENVVNYFNPSKIEEYREKAKEEFQNLLEDAFESGDYISEKRTIH